MALNRTRLRFSPVDLASGSEHGMGANSREELWSMTCDGVLPYVTCMWTCQALSGLMFEISAELELSSSPRSGLSGRRTHTTRGRPRHRGGGSRPY